MKIMRNWSNPSNKTEKIAVLLFDEFSNYCLANTVEPLRAANRILGRKAYDWVLLTLDGEPVTSSAGMLVTPQSALSGQGGANMLCIIPSYRFKEHATHACSRELRLAATRFTVLAGFDMGSWLMAKAGLLDGHRATVHWDEIDNFAETFPDIDVVRAKIVIDRNRWTCAGAMTAFDMLQHMIGQTHGEAVRLEVASMFLFGEGGEGYEQADLRPKSQLCTTAITIMREHLEEPMSIALLTQMLRCNRHNLEQAFGRELGAPPKTVYRRLRLTAARRYIEQTGMSVAEIAVRCGYQDPSSMARAFREEFGIAPSSLRRILP